MLVIGGMEGSSGHVVNDAWALTLDPSPHSRRLDPSGLRPSPRMGLSASYDSRRGRVIVFGGLDGTIPSDETWMLGTGDSPWWSRINPYPDYKPPARGFHAAAYDSSNDRLLVFGGTDGGRGLGDLWSLTLSGVPTWMCMSTSGTPPTARAGCRAICDPAHDRLLLFGGSQGQTPLNELWELSPLSSESPTWKELPAAPPWPASRANPTFVADLGGSRLILFGGDYDGRIRFNDLWSLSLDASPVWSNLWNPDSVPGPRAYGSAVLIPRRGSLLLFGGYGGWRSLDLLNECWELELQSNLRWRRVATDGAAPCSRDGHTAVLDPAGDRMIVFGGNAGPNRLQDVWALSLSDPPGWTLLTPDSVGPTARFFHVSCYDPDRLRMVTFGGTDGMLWFGDTWSLDLQGPPAWRKLEDPLLMPTGRGRFAFTYDSKRDRLVVFGSSHAPGNDTWVLPLSDPAQWMPLAVQGELPPPRHAAAAVYDSIHDRVVIFGGTRGNRTALNDVWALSLSSVPTWAEIHPSGTPPAPCQNASVVFDLVGGRMIVYGGDVDYMDIWGDGFILTLDGDPAWLPLVAAGPSPGRRSMMATTYDARRHRMLCFGGQSPNEFGSDLWALDLGEPPSWSLLAPAHAGPAPRREGSAVVDTQLDRLILFGGGSNDTWAYSLGDAGAWQSPLIYGEPPRARSGHAAVYDDAKHRMIVWGGLDGRGEMNDTWVLNLSPPVLDTPQRVTPRAISAVVPNPSFGAHLWVNLVLSDPGDARVRLLDVAGRVVAAMDITRPAADGLRLDLADARRIPPGLYFVHVTQGARSLTKKVCVLN